APTPDARARALRGRIPCGYARPAGAPRVLTTSLVSPEPLLQFGVTDIRPLGPWTALLLAQQARRRAGTLAQAHGDGVAVVGRAAESLPDLVLVLDLDAARRHFPTRCGKIRLDRGVWGQCDRRAEFLPGVECLPHPPPVFGTTVAEFQSPLAAGR